MNSDQINGCLAVFVPVIIFFFIYQFFKKTDNPNDRENQNRAQRDAYNEKHKQMRGVYQRAGHSYGGDVPTPFKSAIIATIIILVVIFLISSCISG